MVFCVTMIHDAPTYSRVRAKQSMRRINEMRGSERENGEMVRKWYERGLKVRDNVRCITRLVRRDRDELRRDEPRDW